MTSALVLSPVVVFHLRIKMASLCVTLAWVTLILQVIPTQECDSFFGNGFDDPNHKSRIFKEKRLSVDEKNPTYLSHPVFTSLQCLDFCLRIDHCLSFDFLVSRGNICRINRATQHTMPLVEDRNWTHFNLSAVYLRKVGPRINFTTSGHWGINILTFYLLATFKRRYKGLYVIAKFLRCIFIIDICMIFLNAVCSREWLNEILTVVSQFWNLIAYTQLSNTLNLESNR